MSWKDYVNYFTDFTLCKLPDIYSENRNGMTFEHQVQKTGKFENDKDGKQIFHLKIEDTLNANVFFQLWFHLV